ncbi:helix-turn-helix domain-containing protein [Candidatus Pantoea formicae]|uniref:helix-turn-helix domain-containing protein n=1 Tax=Candidatus Pantoea formicae TaxID=2608355 RepID=UPI003EDAADE3
MSESKESILSFSEQGKESFRERLQQLIGDRSVRAAAQAWGIPVSTINNYIHKSTEPALRVVMQIAEAEKVSIEWLATGLNKDDCAINRTERVGDFSHLQEVWMMIFESLGQSDIESLIRLIHKYGARGVISAAEAEDALNQTLMALSKDEKHRLLALYEAKKGASEGGELTTAYRPMTKEQKAS